MICLGIVIGLVSLAALAVIYASLDADVKFPMLYDDERMPPIQDGRPVRELEEWDVGEGHDRYP